MHARVSDRDGRRSLIAPAVWRCALTRCRRPGAGAPPSPRWWSASRRSCVAGVCRSPRPCLRSPNTVTAVPDGPRRRRCRRAATRSAGLPWSGSSRRRSLRVARGVALTPVRRRRPRVRRGRGAAPNCPGLGRRARSGSARRWTYGGGPRCALDECHRRDPALRAGSCGTASGRCGFACRRRGPSTRGRCTRLASASRRGHGPAVSDGLPSCSRAGTLAGQAADVRGASRAGRSSSPAARSTASRSRVGADAGRRLGCRPGSPPGDIAAVPRRLRPAPAGSDRAATR